MEAPRIGTCSWNFHSWMGLVYSGPSPTEAGYLREYCRRFRTVEVDSWFHRLPESAEVEECLASVDPGFTFTVLASEELGRPGRRGPGAKARVADPAFLSPELFASYLVRLRPLLPRIDAVVLEFAYLDRDCMKSVHEFMRALESFSVHVPANVPLAVETRNMEYLTREYFQFLKSKGLGHVFGERRRMPHVYDVYEDNGDQLAGTTVLRLVGDVQEAEARSGGRWDRIVDEKPDKDRVARMAREIASGGGKVLVDIDNHYEGSAPLSAAWFERELSGPEAAAFLP